ncbi:MAG: ABC transporter permease [Gemmataceae bacterium]
MRVRDLIGLALSALSRQKSRTALTLLGVVIGSCILVVSLSVGTGVRKTVHRLLRAHDRLRQIDVFPDYVSEGPTEPPPEAVEVKGNMNEERRERLRGILRAQWLASHAHRVRKNLTRERLDEIAASPHVEKAYPSIFATGRISFGQKSQAVRIIGLPPDHERLRHRLVAGRSFDSAQEPAIIVNEFLLYDQGFHDDAELDAALGSKVKLQVTPIERSPYALLALLDPDIGQLSPEEQKLLEKAADQVPALLRRLDLGEDNAALKKLLDRFKRSPSTEAIPPTCDLVLAGAFRFPNEDESKRFWDRLDDGDVIIPIGTAERLMDRIPGHRENGFGRAVVIARSEEDVRAAERDIKAAGFHSYSQVEFAEKVKAEVDLITYSMTFISIIALAVSALGITNTMVTSVLERVREIGIMKSVGARDGHILVAFLVEGTLIGFLGGWLGLLAGWLVSLPAEGFARHIMEKQAEAKIDSALFLFPAWLIVSVPLFSAAITTLAAIYPARRASRVDPVVALKYE